MKRKPKIVKAADHFFALVLNNKVEPDALVDLDEFLLMPDLQRASVFHQWIESAEHEAKKRGRGNWRQGKTFFHFAFTRFGSPQIRYGLLIYREGMEHRLATHPSLQGDATTLAVIDEAFNRVTKSSLLA